MNVGPIAGAALRRTLKGLLGLWCIFGPLIPVAVLWESNPTAGASFSICLGLLVYGFSAWKYRKGSADTIRSILNDTGMTAAIAGVAALLGGLYSGLTGVRFPFEGGGLLIVIWGGFFFLEWKKSLAVPVEQAPQRTTPTAVRHHPVDMSSEVVAPSEKELEKKAWYRFCKLCYGFGYVVSLAVAVAIGYSEFPVEYIDSDSSMIRCAHGASYSGREISGYFASSKLDSFDDEKAKKLCSPRYVFEETVELPDGRKVEIQVPEGLDPKVEVPKLVDKLKAIPPGTKPIDFQPAENYTFVPVRAVRGSYATLFWGLGIVVLMGELVRRSFLYVVAAVPFFDLSLLRRG